MLNVEIKESGISTSHRLPVPSTPKRDPTKPSEPQAIIARFINRDVQNDIYCGRKAARKLRPKDFPVEIMTQLYVNKNLTQQRKRLLWSAKQRAIEKDYKYVWPNNDKILVRKTKQSLILLVICEGDLFQIV